MRVFDYLLRAEREVPQRAAIEFQGRSTSFGELAEEARRVGAMIRRLGVDPDDSVGIMLPNLPQFGSAMFGSLMCGCRVVPMNVLLQPPEIAYLCEDSAIRLIFTWEGFLPQVEAGIKGLKNPPQVVVIGAQKGAHKAYHEEVVESPGFEPHDADTDSIAMTIYTSGTTGKPKGALLTHSNIVANMNMMDEVFSPEEGDRYLIVLPLFHVFALNGLFNAAVKNQVTCVLHPKFDVADAVRSLASDGITMFAGVPTMYFYLLKVPNAASVSFPKLKYCISGGAAMPVDVLHQFEATFGAKIYEGYGLTETTVSVCCNKPGGERKIGSIGRPYANVGLKVVDDDGNEVPHGEPGEIIVKAANVMQGYLNKPEATAESIKDGWFYTGDIGHRDEDGFFYIVDRKKDMIIKGGYNIYPREIEEVIYQMPEVAEAAVVGIFDEAKGELVRAVIALKPGKSLTEEDVRRHVEANLAKYKHPNDYMFIDELPKGPTGKILKREIKSKWAQWNKDRVSSRLEEAKA